MLCKGGVTWSIYLLTDLVCSEHISSEQQEYLHFWVQLRNVFGDVVEMRLMQNCTWCWDLNSIVWDFKTLEERWERDEQFAIQRLYLESLSFPAISCHDTRACSEMVRKWFVFHTEQVEELWSG